MLVHALSILLGSINNKQFMVVVIYSCCSHIVLLLGAELIQVLQ